MKDFDRFRLILHRVRDVELVSVACLLLFLEPQHLSLPDILCTRVSLCLLSLLVLEWNRSGGGAFFFVILSSLPLSPACT